MAKYGWKMEIITGSYPIDFNLFNRHTNYVEKKEVGRECYESGLEIENLMRDAMGIDGLTDIYRKFGEAGLGRSITAYFTLQKRGIVIRRIREEELGLILKWRTDPDISKYMKTDFYATLEMQNKWYDDVKKDSSKKYWMIEIDSVPAGVICLTDINYDLKTCEWGYYIGVKERRSFAAAVSIECSLYDYVFQEMGFQKIHCECLGFNTGVIRLHEYCGNHIDEIKRDEVIKNEDSFDLVLMSIGVDEWKEKRKEFSYSSIPFSS